MKSKKGQVFIVIGLIAVLFFILGAGTFLKVTGALKSIPTPLWYLIIFVLILMLLKDRKK